jgi:hypothetical protein
MNDAPAASSQTMTLRPSVIQGVTASGVRFLTTRKNTTKKIFDNIDAFCSFN